MKTLVCTLPGQLDYVDRPKPAAEPGHTLLRIRRVGICGTDIHAFDGTQPYFEYPRVLGHELAAEIEETDAEGFRKGDRVTIIPYLHCGSCLACRSGKPNCCVSMKVCGVHIDGGMCEYFSVPSTALVHSQGLGLEELALVEPLAIGAHAVRRAAVENGEWVLVIGAGPIGLGTMEFARIAGANVIAMDVLESRLGFCRDRLQTPFAINATGAVLKELAAITGGDMPSVVIDATGNLRAINTAFQYLGHGGRYVLVGLQKENISFSHPEFHKREATLMSSRNATREDFDHVISSISRKKAVPEAYITHHFEFNRVKENFQKLSDPNTMVIKAMIEI